MADVFISYHEESAGELAEQIADALDAAGISAWCARRDLIPGEVFAEEIPKRIHECRLFLLILNERVYDSAHIRAEVGIAFSRVNKGENIRIFPLNVVKFSLKGWLEYYLIHPQGMNFPAQPDKQRLQRLVKRIAKTLNRETPPAQVAPIPRLTQPPPLERIIQRGQCGDNVNYTLDENGVLTMSGKGSMWDFDWNEKTETYNTPWRNKCSTISYAELQNGVTSIGKGTFFDCIGLTSITISDSVTQIGRNAFAHCERLTSIVIPDSVMCIGAWAFYYSNLHIVTIPESVTEIGAGAFFGTMLASVTIPSGVMEIKDDTFGRTRLRNVQIPDSVKKIGADAFHACYGLGNVSVPKDAEIHPSAFPHGVRIERR